MGNGRRTRGKNLNIKKVIMAIILIVVIIITIICLINVKKSKKDSNDKNISNNNSKTQNTATVQNKVKTIEELVSEFGGEIVEQVKEDTCYIKKDGKEYTAYQDGEIVEGWIIPWTGTSTKPAIDAAGNINIYTAEELKWVADQVINGEMNFSGVTITLRNNIDLGARKNSKGLVEGTQWTAIIGFLDELQIESNVTNIVEDPALTDPSVNVTEENLKRFAGVFNGNNYSIRGMYINSNKKYQGLFGFSTGTIQNLNVKYSYLIADSAVGTIVGLNGGTIVNCKVENCEIMGNGKIGAITGINMVNSWIENCSTIGDVCVVNSSSDYVGGIAGYVNNNSAIINCTNKAIIIGKNYVGGISGIAFFGATIKDCFNTSSNMSGEEYIGGIVGYSQAEISNSYNNSKNIKGNNYIGGIVGANYLMGNIEACYNSGMITVKQDNAGGIAGMNNDTISNCYNIGYIDATETDGVKIGGICGQNISDSFIYTSYNIGDVRARGHAEGIAGADFGTVNKSFYLDTSVNTEQQYKQNMRTQEAMKSSILTELGTSFKIDSKNINSGYPILNWQEIE